MEEHSKIGDAVPALSLPSKPDAAKPAMGKVLRESTSHEGGGLLQMFSPRNLMTPRTPREPEEMEITASLVFSTEEIRDGGVIFLEGAIVKEISSTSLAARFRTKYDFGLREDDRVLSISGQPFGTGATIDNFLKAGQRAYCVRVRRMAVRKNTSLTARLGYAMAAIANGVPITAPETEEALATLLLEWEYYRPKEAYPDRDPRQDQENVEENILSNAE